MGRAHINLGLDEEMLQEIDRAVKRSGSMNRLAFIRQAIQFYLTADKLKDSDSPLLGRDAAAEIERSLRPLYRQLDEQNRMIKILMNLIWHRINYDVSITEAELTRLVKEAVMEVDEKDDFTSTVLLGSARSERMNKHNSMMKKSAPAVQSSSPSANTPSANQSANPQRTNQTSIPFGASQNQSRPNGIGISIPQSQNQQKPKKDEDDDFYAGAFEQRYYNE